MAKVKSDMLGDAELSCVVEQDRPSLFEGARMQRAVATQSKLVGLVLNKSNLHMTFEGNLTLGTH